MDMHINMDPLHMHQRLGTNYLHKSLRSKADYCAPKPTTPRPQKGKQTRDCICMTVMKEMVSPTSMHTQAILSN